MRTHRFPILGGVVVPASLMLALQFLPAMPVAAQDAVVADPKHYQVEFENDDVRVLRITYGPHEKSVLHEHPANVAVFLTDGDGQFTMPDGKTIGWHSKAGTVQSDAGGKHLPENLGDQPFELILVELKGKRTAAD